MPRRQITSVPSCPTAWRTSGVYEVIGTYGGHPAVPIICSEWNIWPSISVSRQRASISFPESRVILCGAPQIPAKHTLAYEMGVVYWDRMVWALVGAMHGRHNVPRMFDLRDNACVPIWSSDPSDVGSLNSHQDVMEHIGYSVFADDEYDVGDIRGYMSRIDDGVPKC